MRCIPTIGLGAFALLLLACASEPAVEEEAVAPPEPDPPAPDVQRPAPPPMPAPLDVAAFEPAEDDAPSSPEPARPPRNGHWELRWPNGDLAATGTFRNGRRHGRFTFYAGGEVFETGMYERGEPVGEWVSHHRDGSPRRVVLAPGYCTRDSVLRGAPRPVRYCGNAIRSNAADPRLEPAAAALRRCIDHADRWLRRHLEARDPQRNHAAVQLVERSQSPTALRIRRDVLADAIDDLNGPRARPRFVQIAFPAVDVARFPALRRRALAAFETGDDSTQTSWGPRLEHVARSSPLVAERYFAVNVRSVAAGSDSARYWLLGAARILSAHRDEEQRVALWSGLARWMQRAPAASIAGPDNFDGWVHVELARACDATGRPDCVAEHLSRAIEIFEATRCASCLDEARVLQDPSP